MDKLIGELDEEESRGVLRVLGKVKRGSIVVSNPEGKVSVEIMESNSKVKPIIDKGSIKISTEIEVENNLGENQRQQNLILIRCCIGYVPGTKLKVIPQVIPLFCLSDSCTCNCSFTK